MRFRSVLGVVGAVILATSNAAVAAPATPDQAAAVKAALERYVGGGAGGPSPVAVTPEGDHYAIAIDLKQALHGLEAFGVVVEPATYTMAAAPLDAGTWHVTSNGVPRVTIKHDGNSYSVVVNGLNFDGVYDPALLGFQTSTMTYESMSIAVVTPQGETQTREIRQGKQTSTTTAASGGGVNARVTQSNEGFSQDVGGDIPGPNGKPGTLSVKSASTGGTVAIDGLRSRALGDLWVYFVAHASKPAIKASQAELKDLLRKALPLFDEWSQGGSAERLAVDSPFGAFAAQQIGGEFKLTGLVADGKIESKLHYDAATFPTGLLPAWSEGLIPTAASVSETVSGFHLDAAAAHVIDNLDLDARDPLSPEAVAKLKVLVGPLDQMVVTVLPSHLESQDLKIDLSGKIHLTQPIPDFHATIRASGLDKALQSIQAKSAGDKTASQVIAVLLLAKGLGKAEADGSLSWIVSKSGTGEVLINGLSLPGAGK